MGFYIILIAALYAYLQFKVLPVLCYRIGKKRGLPRWGAVLCAVAGFLVLAVPVWHKELPALIVYNRLKKECGTVIHKPFEQWVRENPGVLETLVSDYTRFRDTRIKMGDKYPNRYLSYTGKQFRIIDELHSQDNQRIICYTAWMNPVSNVEKNVEILYDLKTKEVLAEKTKIVYGPLFGLEPLWKTRYKGNEAAFDEYENQFYKAAEINKHRRTQ